MSTPRSRNQVARSTGVSIGTLRYMEADGLLDPGNLTLADEIVVRALTWADGARGGDKDHERALAEHVRSLLSDSSTTTPALLVLVDDEVMAAADELEALLRMRGRRGVVTLLPLGAWIVEALAA